MNIQLLNSLRAHRSFLLDRKAPLVLDKELGTAHFSATAEAALDNIDAMLANTDLCILAEQGDSEAIGKIKERNEYLREMLDRAIGGDAEARAEMVQLQVERINNFITAGSAPLAFFEVINLGATDQAYYQNETDFEIGVSDVGEDGKSRGAQAIRRQDQVAVRLHPLATDELEFPLVDLTRGNIADTSNMQRIATRDLEMKLATRLWTILRNCIGSFVTTGTPQRRTYVAHSAIQTDNFPTTNALSATSDGAFKLNGLMLIHEYAVAWGDAMGGEIVPLEVRIPPKDVLGMAREISATTQITAESLSNQIAKVGYVHDLFGRKVVLRGDPMLSTTTGHAFVRFNRPCAKLYFKPELDRFFTELNLKAGPNKGSVKAGKVWGSAVPNPGKINIARVAYKP